MKKLIRIFIAILMVTCLAFSLGGCEFIVTNNELNNDGSGGITTEGGQTGGGNTNSGSSSGSQNVTLKEVTFCVNSERQEYSRTDAIGKVQKSVVAIEMGSGSSGAGVIANVDLEGDTEDDVYIITCHHVISQKGDLNVLLPDENAKYGDNDYVFSGTIGGDVSANQNKAVTLVGGVEKADIAVLKLDISKPAVSGKVLDKTKIVKVNLAPDEYQAQLGEEVFAIGNPTGGLPGWVSCGSIASLESDSLVEDIGNMLLMGIDVATNPGNSGGGLFNLYGELIGITNAGNTNYNGINFAIPLYTSNKDADGVIDLGVKNVVKNLMGTKTAENYGFLPGQRVTFGLTVSKLVGTDYPTVSAVTKDSLAAAAGFKVNDRISKVKVGDASEVNITSYELYIEQMDTMKLGDVIIITVLRPINSSYAETKVLQLQVEQYHFCNTGIFPEQ